MCFLSLFVCLIFIWVEWKIGEEPKSWRAKMPFSSIIFYWNVESFVSCCTRGSTTLTADCILINDFLVAIFDPNRMRTVYIFKYVYQYQCIRFEIERDTWKSDETRQLNAMKISPSVFCASESLENRANHKNKTKRKEKKSDWNRFLRNVPAVQTT